jgi:hypothetical protein
VIDERALEVGVGFQFGSCGPTTLALGEMRTKRVRLDWESSRLTHEHPEVQRMRTRRCRMHRVELPPAFRREPSDRRFRLGTGRDADDQIGARKITAGLLNHISWGGRAKGVIGEPMVGRDDDGARSRWPRPHRDDAAEVFGMRGNPNVGQE